MFTDNKALGQFDLMGIPPAPRGVPQVEVTFDIDTNGILNVSAKDLGTAKEQKIKITGSSNLSKDEVGRMKEEAKKHEAEDKKQKAKIEAENNADAVVFQTKKVLDEFKDKIDATTKKKIEAGMAAVEEARKGGDPDAINSKIDELNKVVQEIGTRMYQEAAAKQQKAGAGPGTTEDENIVDAEFKEKREEKA